MKDMVLCLNTSWLAIGLKTVRNCFKLLSKGHARALDENYILHTFDEWLIYHDVYGKDPTATHNNIRTVRLEIPVPEIIVLKYDHKLPRMTLSFTKENLFVRDSGCCVYCGDEVSYRDATIDHVIPQSRGGVSSFENCVISCSKCNGVKADYHLDDLTDTHRLDVKPRRPNTTNPLYRMRNGRQKINILPSWDKFLIHR